MAIRILWEPHVLVCHLSGTLSVDDIHTLNNDTYNNPLYKSIGGVILDYNEVTATTISHADVSIIASADHLYGQLDRPRCMAIICKPNSRLRQLAQQYRNETSETSLEIAFFDNRVSARNWLAATIIEHGEIS